MLALVFPVDESSSGGLTLRREGNWQRVIKSCGVRAHMLFRIFPPVQV